MVRALKASPLAEARYVRDLRKIMGSVHDGVMQVLAPHMGGVRKDAVGDSHKALASLEPKIVRYVRTETGVAFDRMSKATDAKSARAAEGLFRISPGMSTHVEIQKFRDQNIALVENAGREYAAQVREVFGDPANFGLRAEELADKLRERADVSQSRAELIARDQTLKLNSQLNTTRQQNAGVTQFDWSTSGDERVRPDHAKLDGQRFAYNDPPVTDERTGARNLPGMDFQCRCLPLPVVDEFEGI